MANGFEIDITESDFKNRSVVEQNWINFKGIVATNKCIDKIDRSGCAFAHDRYRKSSLARISAMAGGITAALGVVYILWNMMCK